MRHPILYSIFFHGFSGNHHFTSQQIDQKSKSIRIMSATSHRSPCAVNSDRDRYTKRSALAAASRPPSIMDGLHRTASRRAPGAAGGLHRMRSMSIGMGERQGTGMGKQIPDWARAGLKSAALSVAMDSTEEVARWLEELGMVQYVPSFRAQSVTGNVLLSLNSAELRITLGVTKLKDRRVLIDAIDYLRQTLAVDAKVVLPEDGRILTHLSNERLFLVWLRFCVVMQTVAMATVRLENTSNGENTRYVVVCAAFLALLAAIAVTYAAYRYYWMHRMVEAPREIFRHDNVAVFTPCLIACVAATITLYALMAHDTEEAALLALLAL